MLNHMIAGFAMIQSGVSTSSRRKRVRSRMQNYRRQEKEWGRALGCAMPTLVQGQLKDRDGYLWAPSRNNIFIVIQRGYVLHEVTHWQRVALPNDSANIPLESPRQCHWIRKRTTTCRTRSLHALSQDIAWVGSWILLAEVILSEVRGHHLPPQTFSKFNTAMGAALYFRSAITCEDHKN